MKCQGKYIDQLPEGRQRVIIVEEGDEHVFHPTDDFSEETVNQIKEGTLQASGYFLYYEGSKQKLKEKMKKLNQKTETY